LTKDLPFADQGIRSGMLRPYPVLFSSGLISVVVTVALRSGIGFAMKRLILPERFCLKLT
jgi:hypothetical protein